MYWSILLNMPTDVLYSNIRRTSMLQLNALEGHAATRQLLNDERYVSSDAASLYESRNPEFISTAG